MTDVDLFGNPVEPPRKTPLPRGHAAPPGSGPAGETCKSCAHARATGGNRTYWKCGLARRRWTSGLATDIRLRDPACRLWEAAGE